MKRQVRSSVFSLQKTSLAAVLGLLAAGGAIGGEVAWAPQNGSTDISAPDNRNRLMHERPHVGYARCSIDPQR